MCYSAQIRAEYKKYVRAFGATIDIKQYVEIYWQRQQNKAIKIPRTIDFDFLGSKDGEEGELAKLIAGYNQAQTLASEQELFKQRKRLADAERSLSVKTTKAAQESQRIATDKIERLREKLDDLRRHTIKPRDGRFFPQWYAPVMICEEGRYVVKLMRYQCRPAGKPANYDVRYPGTFNARRDNLQKFWKGQFGHTHGLLIADSFYENVTRQREDGSEYNEILQFRPNTHGEMLVACLWSHWTGAGEPDLLSFAAITDEPPEEVAAAGHDRCIIPIKADHVAQWLNPNPDRLDESFAILDDRERPYYEHRLAA
jgi:putative SOS response-associated peptidase YedK